MIIDDRKLISYALLGTAAAVGTVYLINKVSGALRDNRVQGHYIAASVVGSPDYFAQQFQTAFDYFGFLGNTDIDLIKRTLREIPSQEVFNQIQTIYRQVYGKILLEELAKELSDSFYFNYQDAMTIIRQKPAK